MRHLLVVPYLICALTLLAGCGGGSGGSSTPASDTAPAASSGAAGSSALPAGLDDGPRASESAIDEDQAELGRKLFQDKGCSACHAFGKRVTGPDLAGVSTRRTARWMEQQILHPDVMTKHDPIARQMFAQFALQMPNQKLTEAEARAVIEYLKHQDHESAEGREAGKEKD